LGAGKSCANRKNLEQNEKIQQADNRKSTKRPSEPEVFCEVALTYGQDISSRVPHLPGPELSTQLAGLSSLAAHPDGVTRADLLASCLASTETVYLGINFNLHAGRSIK